jgi:hypothetical protein
MVWKILRPHYWILDRKVRTTNRYVVLALIVLLGFGGQWVFDNLIRNTFAILSSEQAVTAIASSLPFALSLLLVFAILGVGDMVHQLYLTSDLELLMIAPIPRRTVFLVKVLQCSRTTFIPALAFLGGLLALGLARGATLSYYLLTVLFILAAMLLTTAVVVTLVILLARLLPAQKTRSWMPVALLLATSIVILGQQSATEWFLGQTDLIALLTEALLNPGQLGLLVAGLGGLALVTSLVAYQAFNTSFHEGWNRFQSVPTRAPPRTQAVCRQSAASLMLRQLPQPFRSLMVKEWLALRHDPRGLINLAQPLVLVIMVLVLFMGGGEATEALQPLIFWIMLIFLVMFLSVLPSGLPLLSIAQEGRNFALLRSAPISMSDTLKGKFWAAWVPLAVAWVLVFLVAGLLLQFPWWQIGFLAGVTTWGLTGGSGVTMAIGGLKIDFGAEELGRRTPTLPSYLMMGLNLGFVIVTTAGFVWLLVRLLPDSRIVLAIQSLAGYTLVGWLFSDKLWIPLVLVGSQVLFWIGARALWAAAVNRLEGWEAS